jgi:hypothetical protein
MIRLKIGFVLIILLIQHSAYGCDVCGCSSFGMSGTLFPQIQNNLLGIRYMPVTQTHPNSFNGINNKVYRDIYHDAELFFRWKPAKRLQIWFNVPVGIHMREETVRTTQIKGIGDIQANAMYSIIQTSDSSHAKFRHLLMAGGGFGMPTGKYQQRDETLTTLPVNFQMGSGAWSVRTSALYLIRHNRFGGQAQADFQTFSTNESDFKKGNQISGMAQVFYRFPLKNGLILPQIGLRQEKLFEDNEFGKRKLDSGGSNTWSAFNLDYYANGWMLGLTVQLPVQIRLNGNQAVSGPRFGLTLGLIW